MKRSELTLTGKSYRVLNTRETSMIMTDEDLVLKLMAEGLDNPDYEPDEGDIDEVKIAADKNGKFYAILEPSYIRSSREWINENMYKLCENPAEAYDGSFLYLESKWNIFEDEE